MFNNTPRPSHNSHHSAHFRGPSSHCPTRPSVRLPLIFSLNNSHLGGLNIQYSFNTLPPHNSLRLVNCPHTLRLHYPKYNPFSLQN